MAAYDLEEQEQLSAIKAWWEKNGNRVTWAMTAVAVMLAAWVAWQKYQEAEARRTGALYTTIIQTVQGKDIAKQRALTNEIVTKYGNSISAQMAALMLGKSELDAGNLKAAHAQFEWAATQGTDALTRDVARLRLASVQLDEKDPAGALKTLETSPAKALEARFEDLRGDVLFAKGDQSAARDAYKKALAALGDAGQAGSQFRYVVQTKLDALGGA